MFLLKFSVRGTSPLKSKEEEKYERKMNKRKEISRKIAKLSIGSKQMGQN